MYKKADMEVFHPALDILKAGC